ncbi:MAG: hypothetical protein CM15mV7_1170 [uncultured marine virus]|nr:MAG: hypothetical protein CM15mV7_1170 [uncultured marine virus]
MTGKGRHTPSPKIPSAKPNFKKNPSAQRISDLNTSHPAKKYLLDRKIPEAQLSRFYYVDKFMSWVNTHKKTFEKLHTTNLELLSHSLVMMVRGLECRVALWRSIQTYGTSP